MILNTGASSAAPEGVEVWTVRGLLARHRLAALGLAAVTVVMLAIILLTVFGSKAGAVSDATTCSQWGSANQDQQVAFARLYVREHGALRGGTTPATVIAAINNGCTKAYGEDVSDTVSVVQAISGNF